MHHTQAKWTHGIDDKQDEVIQKACRQYEKKTGRPINRYAMVKRMVMMFGEDMDIVSADMNHAERRKAWETWIKKG